MVQRRKRLTVRKEQSTPRSKTRASQAAQGDRAMDTINVISPYRDDDGHVGLRRSSRSAWKKNHSFVAPTP